MAKRDKHRCLFTGCDGEAVHHLGIRLRNYPGPNNTWTQDTGAWLCDGHARVGLAINIDVVEHENRKKLYTGVSNDGGELFENETDLNPEKLPPLA